MANVSIHSDAEAEYEAALAWYMARGEKAATGFETAFEQAVESIAANPELYPSCDSHHRFRLLRRYPYSLIYRIEGDRVQIVAVAHSRRLPGYWSGRA